MPLLSYTDQYSIRMKRNEDNTTWISNILVRHIFCVFKTSLLLLNFCLYVYVNKC